MSHKAVKIQELINAVETTASGVYCMRENRDKRSEQRFSLIVDCTVGNGTGIVGAPAPATIENVSRNGLEIRRSGEPLKQGDSLSISFSVERMSTIRDAEVAWSKSTEGKKYLAGLRLTEPIPVYWILSAMPQIDITHN